MLTAQDGLFNNTNKASAKYKQESMIEAVKTADLYLEVDMRMGDEKKDKKEIGDLLNKLEELGGIKAPEYKILDGENENQKTIVDPKTKVVLDITIDENNEVIIDPSIVKDVTNLTAPTVSWTITPPKETTAETVTIEITITEEKNGIAKIKFQDEEEEILGNVNGPITRTYEITKNGSYKFMAEGGNGRKITKMIPIDHIRVPVPIPIAEVVKVGDYVNYDAGKWTEEDFELIENSPSEVKPTVNRRKALPNYPEHFGGFEKEDSRNGSSIQHNWTNQSTNITYGTPKSDGWRVWDIDETTGIVTLISAGNPEAYVNDFGAGAESVDILKNRDCSMYVNEEYATSARILRGEDAVSWYNKNFGTSHTLSTFYDKPFTTLEPISVLENCSYYWFASAYDTNSLYYVNPVNRVVRICFCARLTSFRGSPISFFKL